MSEHRGAPADWTRGDEGIALQQCGDCESVWYFRRDFCPACGAGRLHERASQGHGTVHAVTLVHRAPSDEFRALAPYLVVLVEVDEGFRMMGHGEPGLAIGDRVRCGFRQSAGRVLPYFGRNA